MRFRMNDRYIKGMVAFESYGDTADLSYIGPPLPVNIQYELQGLKWKVTKAYPSVYNPQVTNVKLERIIQE